MDLNNRLPFPEDPVFVLKHTKPPVNSVLKMLVDLFSIPETTLLFYTNDVKVLIDILVRQLSDLSAGDSVRVLFQCAVTFGKNLFLYSFASGISNCAGESYATLTTQNINIALSI